jgi:nucleoid DNA-binding protein
MAATDNKENQPPLNRGDIVDDVAAQVNLPKSKVDEVLRAFEGALSRPLLSGREVRIARFGTFKVTERSARPGRNPKTGEPMEIGASRNISFKPAAAFRAAGTGGKQQPDGATAKSKGTKEKSKGATAKNKGTAKSDAQVAKTKRAKHKQ